MAQYTAIQWCDMHEFLVGQGFKLLNPPRNRTLPGFVLPEQVVKNPSMEFYSPRPTYEMVYGRRITVQNDPMQLSLRVYSSITPFEGEAREKGADAIRVCIFYRRVDNGVAEQSVMIGGERRCHRVLGWKKNLGDRIGKWPDMIGPKCHCGRPMVERDGKHGKFWGCTGWRKNDPSSCNGIVRFGQENMPRCPDCGGVLIERNGSRGKFRGCGNFPRCKYTEDIREAV